MGLKTTVLLRHTVEDGNDAYRTVAYLVGPAAASTSISLTAATATQWFVVIDLPGGLATSLGDIAKALLPASAPSSGARPLDGTNPPPPPGPVHGGNAM